MALIFDLSPMIFAANWKMNLSLADAQDLARAYLNAQFPAEHQVIVLASDLSISKVVDILKADPRFKVYSQDISIFNGYGNFTGEVSAHQVQDAGAQGCLIGHMERRTHLRENDNEINLKVKNALKTGLEVILSVGETSAEWTPAEQKKNIEAQLKQDLHEITPELIEGKLSIAFETVATISSFGNTSSGATLPVEDIFRKIGIIRKWLAKNYPAVNFPIIYGGSVAAENVAQFVTSDGVGFDGFLVGKKSLDSNEFKKLLEGV